MLASGEDYDRTETIRRVVFKIKNTRDGLVAWNDDLKITAEGETYTDLVAVIHEILDDNEVSGGMP